MGCPCFPQPENATKQAWCPCELPGNLRKISQERSLKAVRQARRKLPDELRIHALALRADGRTYESIAMTLDISERQVRKWWHAEQAKGVV